jgi:hypothetical protein
LGPVHGVQHRELLESRGTLSRSNVSLIEGQNLPLREGEFDLASPLRCSHT